MKHSLFELFKIGIGPSSSHTMGPMRAALRFVNELASTELVSQTASIQADLYGSLALTGHGHGTDRAILLGLAGQTPEGIDPAGIEARLSAIRAAGRLELPGHHAVAFDETKHLVFHRDQMYPVVDIPSHPNGMRFSAFGGDGVLLLEQIFFSIGGGFIVSEAERVAAQASQASADNGTTGVPYPFHNAEELLQRAAANNITVSQLMLANECALVEIGRCGDRGYPFPAEEEVRRRILLSGRSCGSARSAESHPRASCPVVLRCAAALRGLRRGCAQALQRTRSLRSIGLPCMPWPSTKKTRQGGVL